MVTPTKYSRPRRRYKRGLVSQKLTMTGSNPPRRTKVVSDRRGSADVVSFRSIFYVATTSCAGACQAAPGPPPKGHSNEICSKRLRNLACRQAGSLRTRCLLDCSWHGDGARRLVGRHGHLFCVP